MTKFFCTCLFRSLWPLHLAWPAQIYCAIILHYLLFCFKGYQLPHYFCSEHRFLELLLPHSVPGVYSSLLRSWPRISSVTHASSLWWSQKPTEKHGLQKNSKLRNGAWPRPGCVMCTEGSIHKDQVTGESSDVLQSSSNLIVRKKSANCPKTLQRNKMSS